MLVFLGDGEPSYPDRLPFCNAPLFQVTTPKKPSRLKAPSPRREDKKAPAACPEPAVEAFVESHLSMSPRDLAMMKLQEVRPYSSLVTHQTLGQITDSKP